MLGAGLLTSVIVLSLVHFANWQSPASEDDFELIVRRAEQLAAEDPWAVDEYDELTGRPTSTTRSSSTARRTSRRWSAPRSTSCRSSSIARSSTWRSSSPTAARAVRTGRGRRGAYGLYQGDTVVQNYFHDRIVIFRDTLMRDFGHDPELLREQVTRTVRHELAHHLGWDERGVGGLGL